MPDTSEGSLRAGMKTSPWIILGSTAILLIVMVVLAFQNTNRERRYMSELLSAKGIVAYRLDKA
jgi:two-component system sensor histidine kinase HydH